MQCSRKFVRIGDSTWAIPTSHSGGPDDESPDPEMTNGDASPAGDDPALFTDARLIRVIDEKAPRKELTS